MFSTYKRVFWLSVVMSLFVFAPFDITGFSTDVWTRLARIREWVNAGFPANEQLMMGQNYPFGFEMHWTRPLDYIGYALAWTFIPNWGLHDALEIMACFTPILVFLIGLRGYYYGVRGYIIPKIAFFAFWLFFYGVGYSWGQASVGYFDHHIFHFAILVWTIAFIARSFLVRHKTMFLIGAGLLTALGTWITPEFFINSYLLTIPFCLYWLFKNRSLTPALIYLATYVIALTSVLTFDHPIAGFWTLDLYRPSLIHVILGLTHLIFLGLLSLPIFRKNIIRRMIYTILWGSVLSLILLFNFDFVLLAPMVDPIQYHFWTRKVTEMAPLYKDWCGMVLYAIMPFILACGLTLWAIKHHSHKFIPLLLIGCFGIFFYVPIIIFHVRVGISEQAFFTFLIPIYLSICFEQRPNTFRKELFCVIFCCLFCGIAAKGTTIIDSFKVWGAQHILNKYRNDNTTKVPDELKDGFDKILQKEKNDQENIKPQDPKKPKHPEDDHFACAPSKTVLDYLKKDKGTGAIFTSIFEAPQILWETGRPILSGPYDRNMSALTDLFTIELDRPPFTRAKELLKKHNVELLYLTSPKCQAFLFGDDKGNAKENIDSTFWFSTYYQTKDSPKWLKLEYHNYKTNIKIFRFTP